jgi:N utilization substance protein B
VPPKRRPKNKRRPNIPGVDRRAYVESSAARHQARVLAMQSLFEWDLTERDPQEILVRLRGEDAAELPESAQSTADEDEGQFDDIPQPVAERAIALFSGVLEYQGEIDPVIEKAAPQFPIPQIAAIDRNVLRMAIFELRHATDVPYKVVINEAVEIAKRFGGPNSGRFVNGVLGTISRGLTEERRAT